LRNKELIAKFAHRLKSPSEIILSLPENDTRILSAAEVLRDIGLNIITCNDIKEDDKDYSAILKNYKFSSNWPTEKLINYLEDYYIHSLCMLIDNRIGGVVCGCTVPTSDILRGALRIVGLKLSSKWLSSMFLMVDKNTGSFMTFADCAVIPEPHSEQLAEIAFESSKMHQKITGEKAKIGFLSFSTKGSAEHYRVKIVKDAVELFSKKDCNFDYEGEIQLDAAINFEISKKKINNSKLKGNANTLIFPNLDAGNIAYKLMQEFGSYYACGPLLLGLNKSVNDLSRGASIEDIVLISIITALQIENTKDANL